MAFKFQKLAIPEVVLIEPEVHRDGRGFFAEIFKATEFAGLAGSFVQVNHSKSSRNVLRGLHYQKSPMAQAKLVRVLEGKIFDVALDIRKSSPSFGKHVSITLDFDSMKMLFIPEGFAHGFCVLSETAQIEYYCTNVYSPEHERGIIYNDGELKINWPVKDPVLSGKDSRYPSFKDLDANF